MKALIFFRRKLLIPIVVTLTTYFMHDTLNTIKDAIVIFLVSFLIVWFLDAIVGKYRE